MLRRLLMVFSLLAWIAVPVVAMAQTPAGQVAPAQDGYVPVTALPPAQQLPAAPFLIGAYAFVWVALLAYLWSIWRRLGNVQHEMRALEARSHGGSE